MKRGLRIVACTFAVSCLSCQPKQAGHAPGVPARPATLALSPEMGKLVPDDAIGVVYVSSVDEAEATLRDMDRSVGDDSVSVDLLKVVRKYTEIRAERIDRKRPLAVAFSLVNPPLPLPTFILPIADRAGFELDLKWVPASATVVRSGDYAGISMQAGYAIGKSVPAIVAELPAHPLGVRLRTGRIARFVEPFANIFFQSLLQKQAAGADSSLAEAPPGGSAPESAVDSTAGAAPGREMTRQSLEIARGMLQSMLRVMHASDRLDAGLESASGEVKVAFDLRVAPDSVAFLPSPDQARGLVDLARCLPKGYPITSLVALDFAKLADTFEPVYQSMSETQARSMPEAYRGAYLQWVERSIEWKRMIAGQLLTACGFGSHGMEMVMLFPVSDPAVYVGYEDALEGGFRMPGFELVRLPEEQIEGTAVRGFAVKLDPTELARMQGKTRRLDEKEAAEFQRLMSRLLGDSLVVRSALVNGDKALIVMHPDRAVIQQVIARAQDRNSSLPPGLREVGGSAGEPPCLYVNGELRDLVLPMLDAALPDSAREASRQAIEDLRSGPPAPIHVLATVRPQGYRGTLTAGLTGLSHLGKVLDSLPGHKANRKKHD